LGQLGDQGALLRTAHCHQQGLLGSGGLGQALDDLVGHGRRSERPAVRVSPRDRPGQPGQDRVRLAVHGPDDGEQIGVGRSRQPFDHSREPAGGQRAPHVEQSGADALDEFAAVRIENRQLPGAVGPEFHSVGEQDERPRLRVVDRRRQPAEVDGVLQRTRDPVR
jgi:hypothetical protein